MRMKILFDKPAGDMPAEVCRPAAGKGRRGLVLHVMLCWVVCGFLSVQVAFAQNRQIKKADTAFRYHMYDVAVTQYQKAFAKMGKRSRKTDPDLKNRILYQIAESYRYGG
ncbi:MAG: hypothetical protein K2O66_00370, partial [Bacteroidales bacterium]|nr:hypothetical protein [Bacteroidales bacterium]